LTLRQFYYLLAESYAQQKIEDQRWYRLICCWLKDPPVFERVFPLWAEVGSPDEDEDDDEAAFRRVTAGLTPYRN
jgi:hypothetical protein